MSEQVTLTLAENSPLGREGQVVTLSLTPADVHDPTELPTYLAGYKPQGFAADAASKVVLVDHDAGKFRTESADDVFRRVAVKGSIEGAVPEIDPKTSLANYKVVDRFIGSFINDITEQNASPNIKLRQLAMRNCQRKIMLDREIDVWTMLTTSANWDSGNVATLGAGLGWNNSGADPIRDLMNRLEASAQEVTDIWMNDQIGNFFLLHTKVRDYIKHTVGDAGTPNASAAEGLEGGIRTFKLIGLPPIHIVPGRVKNESTGAHDRILSDAVVLTTSLPGIPTDASELATTWTLRRRGGAGVGYETREYRVDNRGPKGGTMVVVSMADIALMTANNVGGLILDVQNTA